MLARSSLCRDGLPRPSACLCSGGASDLLFALCVGAPHRCAACPHNRMTSRSTSDLADSLHASNARLPIASRSSQDEGMHTPGLEPWRLSSRILVTLGVTGCLFVFLWTFGFIGYISSKRSYGPSPDRGWTVSLPWTHGYYGTSQDKQRILQFDDWFLPFLLLAVGGEAIKQFRDKKEPRKRNG